ncbi:serine/threonine-protein kinase Chk1-like [Oratosquilla oratoria]|uniref:serine/threonine-protein kinase Chk1-like n=1 Tax=Oratosquilla oratoria TaxID=337810 RepID=UPI003F75A6BA
MFSYFKFCIKEEEEPEVARRPEGEKPKKKRIKVFGSGFFGTVTLLKNVETKELLARKLIVEYTNTVALREEVLQSQLEHVDVLTLFFWRQEGRTHSLFLEYVTGGRLEDKIRDITEEESLVYFEQLKKGVDHLHTKGIAHRDLKPDNLHITEEKVLKIADFESADVFLFEGEEFRMTGQFGCITYTAPEILEEPSYLGPPGSVLNTVTYNTYYVLVYTGRF